MRAAMFVLALASALPACAGDTEPDAGAGPAIVASIHPVAALVRELDPDARIRTLLPPGAHADTWEPTPRAAEAVEGAALLVRVGAGLDDWVPVGNAGRTLVLADGLDLLDGGGRAGSGNPHVWLDPVLVRDRILPRLADALVQATATDDDDRARDIRDRAAAFADSLTALDAEIGTLLARAPGRRFVAAHPAWSYFAARYGLEQVGVLHPSPGQEIATRELARLVGQARDRDVRAVIAEPQLARGGVEAVAGELDVRVEVADAIGGPGLDGRDRYLDLMRWNAAAFARALGADAP